MDYSISDLATLTGSKPRTIQFWASNGVLTADKGTEKAGTGNPRRFSRHEAIIALIINPFAKLHISIGNLVTIADGIRKLFDGSNGDLEWWDTIESCIAGEEQIDLFVLNSPTSHAAITARTRSKEANDEAINQHIGEIVRTNEKEIGALNIHLPLSTHLKVLK